jgi:hypothetical protein
MSTATLTRPRGSKSESLPFVNAPKPKAVSLEERPSLAQRLFRTSRKPGQAANDLGVKNSPKGLKNTARQPAPKHDQKARAHRRRKFLKNMRVENLLTPQVLVKNYPYVLFLIALGIFYIGNSHFAVKNLKAISTLETELKGLSTEYKVYKADLADRSRQSKVSAALDSTGLKDLVTPPEKIYVAASKAGGDDAAHPLIRDTE